MSTAVGTSNHSAAYKPQVSSGGIAQVSPQQKLSNLFQQIDTDGKGRITKVQFEQAFSKLGLPAPVKNLGQEAILNKLDPNGTGVITKQDFIHRLEPLMNQKPASPAKAALNETKVEVKPTPTPVPKSQANNLATHLAPDEMASKVDSIVLGNIINTTA